MGSSPTVAAHCVAALVVVSNSALRHEVVRAFHAAGAPALAVSRIGEVEHWPIGRIVIVDPAHLTPLWRRFGAREVIVLAHDAREGAAALHSGATGWLTAPVTVAGVMALIADEAAASGLAQVASA
jgi:hypothetical protein